MGAARSLTLWLCLALTPAAAYSQAATQTLTVRVIAADAPVRNARVSARGADAVTDSTGTAMLRLATGAQRIAVSRIGLASVELAVVITRDTTIVVSLEQEAIETEAVIVSSTRSDRRIEDEPVRVEVLGREEIEEKLLMTPGDISMMLNETSGLRVQPTAPALGGASVRIQGLRGRYTQILSDGLPLFGGQTGALGPLQIPPMDLGQVEVIKGVASALYGASALGGVVNLISRRPGEETDRELLLNQTTLGGTDAVFWSSAPVSARWGYTLLASGHRQDAADVDEDGWADLPSFRRALARPRVFWNNGQGASAFLTAGGMVETREGGTADGGVTPDGSSFAESLDTRRGDVGALARVLLGSTTLLTVRGSAVIQQHEHRFDDESERDDHATTFAEAAVAGVAGPHAWVAGLALQHESYAARDVPLFDYRHTVPGAFVQDELTLSPRLTIAASVRVDHHNVYGMFANPRVSALIRPGDGWTVRASGGSGYFAPTPWVEEVESVGLNRLAPIRDLDEERARSASLDVGRAFGPVEINATAFGSRIDNAVRAVQDTADAARLMLVNARAEVETYGTELLLRYHVEGIHVTATHVFMRSTEPDPDGGLRRTVPLTPAHTAGIVAAWEQEGRGRIGAELYYTGTQTLDDNPYRSRSKSYVIAGFLVERRFGPVRVFLNAENVFDTRQTRYDPLLLPARSPEGRWVTDVWAPLDGRSFNAGVRWQL